MRYIYVVLAYTKLSKIIVITVSTVSSLFLLPVAIYLSSCLLFNYKQPPFPKSEQKNSSGCGPRLNYLNEQQKSFSFIQKQTVLQVLWHANSDSLKRQSKPTRGKYGYRNRRHPAIQSWEPGGRRLWEANLAVAQPQEVDFSEVRTDVIERALGRIVWQGQLDRKSGNGGWL